MTWQTRRTSETRRSVVVFGFGRLGGSLTHALDAAGWPVTVFPRSSASVKRAAELGFHLADEESLQAAALCILAVPDAAIEQAALAVSPVLGNHAALVHCAGALSLDAFGKDPAIHFRPRASFHPLVAVSGPEDVLAGHSVALSASNPALLTVLRNMAKDLGLRPLEVPEELRALYHAGAVLAAGSVASLIGAAIESFKLAGIGEADAIAALLPLSRSALAGLEARGPINGLTGPVVRGDVEVVRRHLDALPQELRDIYRALSYRVFQLTGEKHLSAIRAAFLDLLEPRR